MPAPAAYITAPDQTLDAPGMDPCDDREVSSRLVPAHMAAPQVRPPLVKAPMGV